MPALPTKKRDWLDYLFAEEVEAWNEYLETTRHRATHIGYEELETWAWSCLCNRLYDIEARRDRVG